MSKRLSERASEQSYKVPPDTIYEYLLLSSSPDSHHCSAVA